MMAVSDPSDLTQLRLSPHTTYHRNFFLLRVHLTINDQPAQISSDGGHLTISSRYPPVSITFNSLTTEVETIVQKYGLEGVSNYWCEDVPLFELKVPSHEDLKRLLRSEERVQKELESRITAMLAQQQLSESVAVYAEAEVYMLTPLPEGKDAHIIRVTSENLAKCTTEWRESEVFNFGALFRAFRMDRKDIPKKAKPPKITSQPTSQNDVLPGKAVAFSVQATGTEPLGYQWQWKQFGKKGEKDGWQNVSGEGRTFQARVVKASNAGYYRCVVSNSAGSETSQRASLTVVPEVRDLDCELYEVIDWIPLGLRLGIKLPELKIIEKNYPNDLKRHRIEMFEEWQKKVTPTWSAVVQALVGIGMRRLASELAQKHGTPPPKLLDSDPLDKLENIIRQEGEATASVLQEELQKHRGDQLEQDHRNLVDVEKRLRQSQASKAKANVKLSDSETKHEELLGNVEKMAQEKSNLERKLSIKERECKLLCTMQEKDAYNQVLQEKIDKKRKKIKSLKKELQLKESELQSASQEVQTQQKELSEAQTVLKKQHEQVIKLQREREELACSYNIEKKKVSKIVQILTSDKDKMQQQLDKMKEESELKSQQIEACKADISHFSEEIEVLSSSLHEKEAAAAQLQSKLQTCQKVASAPEQLLGLLKVTTQIAELEHKLQEAEYNKLQAELERDAIAQEMKAMENLNAQLHAQFDEPPKLTSQPETLSKVAPGTAALFAVQATGTDPLNFHWQWKPAEECESEEWQPCPAEWSDGAALTIPSVQKPNEGSYHCVVSNYAGTQTSNPAQLTVADPPRVTTHPRELKDAVPGKHAMFSVEATGTEPLSYKWEWNPAGERRGTEEWQPCDLESFPGADSYTVTIPSVQKFNEGSYRCVISNCAGSQISEPAQLSVADPPRVTTHPQELKSILAGKGAIFTVQATGNEPLNYKWEWKPTESEEWEPCDAQGSTLTIPSAQKSNEGSYRCVISNYAGEQTSNPANLTVAEPPRIIAHPQELKALRKTTANFTIRAIGTEPLSYLWQWKPAKRWWMWGGSEEWKPCDAKGSNTATLIIPSVQKSNEGSYRCVISNCAGSQISNSAELETLQLRWRRCRDMEYAMTLYPHCVVMDRTVYVGGGYTSYDDEHSVLKYDLDTDNWSRLPRYQYMWFAVSIINSRLTLVGGRDDGRKVTNQLAVYEPSSQHWTYPYHPMPTPRYSPAVVMYDIWLLVAGGCDAGGRDLATVELLNTSTNQWLAASSLPTPCGLLTSAIVDDHGYVVTDSKQVYRVSLPDIVSQTVDQSTASKSPALWRRLPDTPLSCSAAISLRGYLIAVGGRHDNLTSSADIHLYKPESEQ